MDNEEYDRMLADLEARRIALIPEVRSAFADVPYPGDDGIDEHGYPWDEGVSDYFKSKGQEGHELTDLRHHQAGLYFMLPAALHYYLPAYVIAQLEDHEAVDIGESLLFRFSKTSGREISERLSSPQRWAMSNFFEYLGDMYNYDEADINQVINLLKDLD